MKILRGPSTDEGTFGTLTGQGLTLRTLELPWRDNRPQRSCIPVGTYQCAIVKSPRFGRVYGVADVPGRSHVLIHGGNYAGDVEKGLRSDVEGCILLGLATGVLNGQKVVTSSRAALEQFMKAMDGKAFTLTIEGPK